MHEPQSDALHIENKGGRWIFRITDTAAVVAAFEYRDDASAKAAFDHIFGTYDDLSVWRTTDTARSSWFVIVCGEEKNTDEALAWLEHDSLHPSPLDQLSAVGFMQRRYVVVPRDGEAHDGHITVRNHWEDGVRMTTGGETI